ncbi:hypothetical protein B0T17DRAFT_573861 [Bombardia bombarda]|uniref:Arylamine N-acetyltransferase n=1 Tax=Bombardia bombarda TaxID=252184 RepID=A0AA40C7T0_9PEZI|nr:hypothetical protein B0T17DRAFT_573861 [Bombardia bombarda]
MHTYTKDQLARYFKRIRFTPRDGQEPRDMAASDPLGFLTTLQRLHMVWVPFESLTLHYSRHRLLSLDPEDLFQKIVDNNRGGYCMEVNTLFGTVLRSLGFTLFSAGARVKNQSGYQGWNHMVNIVTVSSTRYLVDVGFGADTPPQPVPLLHPYVFPCVLPVRGRLEYKSIDEHTDANQRVWVFSSQEHADAPWKELYAFVELEFFPADFEVMNLSAMTAPQSYFVQTVVCVRTIMDDEVQGPVGVMILHKDYLKRRLGGETEIVQRFEKEVERVVALAVYFGIGLKGADQRAIRGLASELRGGS